MLAPAARAKVACSWVASEWPIENICEFDVKVVITLGRVSAENSSGAAVIFLIRGGNGPFESDAVLGRGNKFSSP